MNAAQEPQARGALDALERPALPLEQRGRRGALRWLAEEAGEGELAELAACEPQRLSRLLERVHEEELDPAALFRLLGRLGPPVGAALVPRLMAFVEAHLRVGEQVASSEQLRRQLPETLVAALRAMGSFSSERALLVPPLLEVLAREGERNESNPLFEAALDSALLLLREAPREEQAALARVLAEGCGRTSPEGKPGRYLPSRLAEEEFLYAFPAFQEAAERAAIHDWEFALRSLPYLSAPRVEPVFLVHAILNPSRLEEMIRTLTRKGGSGLSGKVLSVLLAAGSQEMRLQVIQRLPQLQALASEAPAEVKQEAGGRKRGIRR